VHDGDEPGFYLLYKLLEFADVQFQYQIFCSCPSATLSGKRSRVAEKIRFVNLAGRLLSAFVLMKMREAYVSRIAKRIQPLPRKDCVQPVCEAETDEVVEATCGRTEMPNRIKALDHIRAPVRPPIRSPPAKPAFRRQCAQIEQQVLFQVEDRILPKPLAQSPRQPVAHTQRISLKKLAKILRDNESILPHVVAIRAYGE